MNNNKDLICFNLILISTVVISFEIISTRISSVIFVNNYAFIILSLAILGLGSGGVFSYYKIHVTDSEKILGTICQFIFYLGLSLMFFSVSVGLIKLTMPLLYFSLLFIPFFIAGIIYSCIFREFAENSFVLYASDLVGAALGAIASLFYFHLMNALNAVVFLSLLIFISVISFLMFSLSLRKTIGLYLFALVGIILILWFGHKDFSGRVPVGFYPEKDFYHVYPNIDEIGYKVEDSRWSLYGRSDLVSYGNQDVVRQLFIDGAAGTPMFRFNGNVQNPGDLLSNLIIQQSTAIPFFFLRQHEKNRMLVIGPGGGKEVLTGLLSGVDEITGVEINPDFVDIVKTYHSFNGGIYTDFSNVEILVKEGRHYIKKTDQLYDLIVMALPSTEQLQNIDNFAMSENYLLTVEAIKDYLNILTSEGRMIFTVHNRWELIRLIVTTIYAFKQLGIQPQSALNHFIILADDLNPTLVIKKQAFSKGEIAFINKTINTIPSELPAVTYLPYHWERVKDSVENRLLKTIRNNQASLTEYIKKNLYDISPVYDDSPYFYKVHRGVPRDYFLLLACIIFLGTLVVLIPFLRITMENKKKISLPLIVFIAIGLGFMMIEVSLFQKLVLYLGSPTISLSILLSSLLLGMGIGSYWGNRIFPDHLYKRLRLVILLIIIAGGLLIIVQPKILNLLLIYGQVIRSIVNFIVLLPFGLLLGIPFPTAIQFLKKRNIELYIPWMYGVNGIFSVLASLLAVIFSMLFGFTVSFFLGLSIYFCLFLLVLLFEESN